MGNKPLMRVFKLQLDSDGHAEHIIDQSMMTGVVQPPLSKNLLAQLLMLSTSAARLLVGVLQQLACCILLSISALLGLVSDLSALLST